MVFEDKVIGQIGLHARIQKHVTPIIFRLLEPPDLICLGQLVSPP